MSWINGRWEQRAVERRAFLGGRVGAGAPGPERAALAPEHPGPRHPWRAHRMAHPLRGAAAARAASARRGPVQAPAALAVVGVRADFEARCASYHNWPTRSTTATWSHR